MSKVLLEDKSEKNINIIQGSSRACCQALCIFKTKKLKRNGLLERKSIKMNVGRWTNEEHQIFLEACLKYGPNWKLVNTKNKLIIF
jgi:hypothetical protein